MLVGAVYVPVLGELFAADPWRRRHARRTSRSAAAIAPTSPWRSSATGFAYARRPGAASRPRSLTEVIGAVRDIRRLGSAALDLCYVAAGRYDAYFETGLNSWDAAAGELIAREAGCRSGDFRGGPSQPGELLVATPGDLRPSCRPGSLRLPR